MNRLERATEFVRQHIIPRVERPVYHLTPPTGWMNDPNGFSVYRDKVHLFYQFHPYSDAWGPMHWGHAVTKDFLNWEDLPVALAPDESYDNAGCFSGTAVVRDGLQVLLYTGSQRAGQGHAQHLIQQQCMAEGDGTTYVKSISNPVITAGMLPDGYVDTDFRDPKVFWHGSSWWLCAAAKTLEGLGDILLYRSDDLIRWQFVSVLLKNDGTLGDMWECPDYFVLGTDEEILMASPMHVKNAGPQFHDGYGTVALIGALDWQTHTFRVRRRVPIDYGIDFYAPQTSLLPDGRRILVAWMQAWENFIKPREQKWHGMMTFPRELHLENDILYQQPARELARTHADTVQHKKTLDADTCTLEGVTGRVVDLTVRILSMKADRFCIRFACKGFDYVSLCWEPAAGTLKFDRTHANDYAATIKDAGAVQSLPVSSAGPEISMRLLLDTCSVEVFLENGLQTFSSTFYAPISAQGIAFESDGHVVFEVTKHTVRLPDS